MDNQKRQVSQNSILNSIIGFGTCVCMLTLEIKLALDPWITKYFLVQTLFSREILPKSPIYKTEKITLTGRYLMRMCHAQSYALNIHDLGFSSQTAL